VQQYTVIDPPVYCSARSPFNVGHCCPNRVQLTFGLTPSFLCKSCISCFDCTKPYRRNSYVNFYHYYCCLPEKHPDATRAKRVCTRCPTHKPASASEIEFYGLNCNFRRESDRFVWSERLPPWWGTGTGHVTVGRTCKFGVSRRFTIRPPSNECVVESRRGRWER
jgi:hypothetical protein